MKKIFLFLTIFFVYNIFSPSFAQTGDLDNLTQTLINAILAKDEAAVRNTSTHDFWTREGDSMQHFYNQSVKKQFGFQQFPAQVKNTRGVVTIYISVSGKGFVDTVYLYAEQKDGKWLFDAIDENEKHIPLFLDGKSPAYLKPEK